MVRGKRLFICSECGKKFVAPDIEYCATIYSMPMPCPDCGSMRTKPLLAPKSFYKTIWDKQANAEAPTDTEINDNQ